MAKLKLNLARQPFVNQRPLLVASSVAAVVVAALTFVNVYRVSDALDRHRLLTQRMAENRVEAAAARDATRALREGVGKDEVKRVKQVARSFWDMIQKRRLSWSRLLDELAQVLPKDVKVQSVVPSVQENYVNLIIKGYAKSDEAMHQFLNQLYDRPFSNARLLDKERSQGMTWFNATCRYDAVPRPGQATAPAPAPAASGTRTARRQPASAGGVIPAAVRGGSGGRP